MIDSETLKNLVINAIEDLKGQDITVLDVEESSSFTDFMIVCSATSDRHLRAIANQIHVDAKKAGSPPLAIEGERSTEWVLVDLGDVVVHIMRPEVRVLYGIESLWKVGKSKRSNTKD